MATVRRIKDPYCLHLAGVVRDRESSPLEVREALSGLGTELARHVLEALHLRPAVVTTPVDDQVEVLVLSGASTLVVTTKSDLSSFGTSAAKRLSPARIGYMNFEGRRGLEALNTPVRDIDIPDVPGRVNTLLIAKSTLATGCTAISLTRQALEEVQPEHLVIITIFHSVEGLQELADAFPDALIFCVGDPDSLDENGMLHPGIGLLDDRI